MALTRDSAPEAPGIGGPRPRRWQSRPLVLAAGALAIVGAAVWWIRDDTPAFDADVFAAALARWRDAPILDYDLELTVQVDSDEAHRATVQVRDGALVAQTYDGVHRESPDDSYTIEGLYRTLGRELEVAGLVPAHTGDAHGSGSAPTTGSRGAPRQTTLRARFHPELPVPIVFKRLTLTESSRSVVIHVDALSIPGLGVVLGDHAPRVAPRAGDGAAAPAARPEAPIR